MKNNLNLTFDNAFKISMTALRLNRAHPKIPRNIFWILWFSFLNVMVFGVVFLLSYSILCHDITEGKFAEASKNCTMVIVAFTVTQKYYALLKYQDSINELICFIERDYTASKDYSDEDKGIVLEYAMNGVKVCKFWLLIGFLTTVLFPLNAFVAMAYYYWQGKFKLVPLFDLTYPPMIDDYKNEPVVFCLLFLYAFSFGSYAATMYIGFDPIVPIFMLHVCGQLEILSHDISRIFDGTNDLREIENRLKTIIIKQQSLYEFMDRIKIIFSLLYECILKATTFLMPLTAFQIIEDLRNHRINIEFISFMVGCVIHFFIPSYFSDLLMEKSEVFRQAIYTSGWEKCPDKRVRQIILFMITRARIPMGIRTVFSEVNLDAFAEMCRQSYGILNLMNAAWE